MRRLNAVKARCDTIMIGGQLVRCSGAGQRKQYSTSLMRLKNHARGKAQEGVVTCATMHELVSTVRADCAPVSWLSARQQGVDVVGKECLSARQQ